MEPRERTAPSGAGRDWGVSTARRAMVAAEGGRRGKRSAGGFRIAPVAAVHLSYIEHLYGVRGRVRL